MADEEKKLTDQFNILFDDITDDFGEAKEEAAALEEEAAAELKATAEGAKEAASETMENAEELFKDVDNAFSDTQEAFDDVKETAEEAVAEAAEEAEEAVQKAEEKAVKKPFVREDPKSLMDEINMEDEESFDSDEADVYENDEAPRKKVVKKPPYEDEDKKKGMSSENLRFWIFTAIVALLVIAAVLFILWKRGIIFHNDDTTTAPTIQTTEATKPSETLPPETTTAEPETTTEAEPTTTEVPEEVKEVLNHYQNLFVVRDQVGDAEVHMLNIRDKASADAKVIAQIARYGGGEILEAGEEWTKISSGGYTGYVKTEYIATGDEAKDLALQHADKYVRVTSENGLRIRQNASATGDPVTVAQFGAIMIYEGEEDGFYHVNYADQFDGFVSMDFSEYDWYLMGAIPTGE